MPGVPASLTSATLLPSRSAAQQLRGGRALVVRVQRDACARSMPWCASRVREVRVSSQATRSAARRTSIERGLASARLPIGVATT